MTTEISELPLDFEAALARCAKGDQFALRAIYERERRWLMAVVLRIVRRHELAHAGRCGFCVPLYHAGKGKCVSANSLKRPNSLTTRSTSATARTKRGMPT